MSANPGDNSAPKAGAAYIFSLANGNLEQLSYVKAGNTAEGDRYGVRVALASTGERLAVAAYKNDFYPLEDDAASPVEDSGAVYVY